MKMIRSVQWMGTEKKAAVGMFTLLLLLFVGSTRGNDDEFLVRQSNKPSAGGFENIEIVTSSSVKDTRTAQEVAAKETALFSIQVSEAVVEGPKSLSLQAGEAAAKKKRHLDDNSINDGSDSTHDSIQLKGSSLSDHHDEYNFIIPTKTQTSESQKIHKTEFEGSGEGQGVPMKNSGPLNPSDQNMSSKSSRDSRGFHAMNRRFEKGTENDYHHNLGANYNKVEQSLGSIAKISMNADNDLKLPNYRESREDENRKANPDIQDIITGIVKILHGKANGPNHPENNRPRPQPSRINNRGPPRISDLPPIDFDSSPSYASQAPPSSHNRVPPPYPFDVPPTPPQSIPLPPQPVKQGSSKLPAHPFIEGVPLPELLVPEKPDYDTISMSEPSGPPLMSSSNSTAQPPIELDLTSLKPDYNKYKTTSKPTSSVVSTNKNGNKRVRPRPTIRPKPTNGTQITKPSENIKNPPLKMKPVTEIIFETTTDIEIDSSDKTSAAQIKPELNQSVEVRNTSKTNIFTNEQTLSTHLSSTKDVATTLMPSVVDKGSSKNTMTLSPLIGIGEATPVLEPSISALSTSIQHQQQSTPLLSTVATRFEARPGIVLDDPEYKPGPHKRPHLTHQPIITAPPRGPYGEIFDVTVHAVQGGDATPGKPVIVPVNVGGGHLGAHDVSVITKPEEGQDFVSIDGKRTYINLFGETAAAQPIVPTITQQPIASTSFPSGLKQSQQQIQPAAASNPHVLPPRRPYKKPVQPPVRIDTCIVGDDTTCDAAQNERCQTEDGVSSCHCRPGYNRKKHRDPCRRVISMMTSLRVDRLYDRKLVWRENFRDPESDEYQELSYEASQAIESAMSMTPFSDDFINSRINSIYIGRNGETDQPAVFINMTLQLEENLDTLRPAVRHDIQRHLIRVIHRRNNNVGSSAVWVDSPPGSVLALEDVDECSSRELHDCHSRADCSNTFGSFKCLCHTGLRDPWLGNIHREGRHCEACGSEFCNNRGECLFEHGQQVCRCTGSFYGAQCEVDGEVLGVAIGASVAAAIIIILTLVCLCMWSRRWSREQKTAVGVGMGSPVFGFMANGPTVKTPNVGAPPYQISIEERMRWAQMADVMAHANHYAQPEPGNEGGRLSYGGYPTLPTLPPHPMGSLPLPAIAPPVPLPRLTLASKAALSTYGGLSQHGSIHQSSHGMRASLDTTSSSEEEDRADLLGRNFSAPRPKSRTSITNQSGIYYDVDLERAEMYGKQTIPMNTYAMNSQHQMRPFFR